MNFKSPSALVAIAPVILIVLALFAILVVLRITA